MGRRRPARRSGEPNPGVRRREPVRLASFRIDSWMRSWCRRLVSRCLLQDAAAREVGRKTFFKTEQSGGTLLSHAHQLALQLPEADDPRPPK